MSTSLEDLARWLAAPREHERLEFKEAKAQYDLSKLFRYCVALANEGGEKLILGVTDRPPRRIVGSLAFSDRGEIQSRILDKLRFRVDVEEIEHPDGRVVIFHVSSRPAGTAYQFEGAYLMRSGEDTVPMSEDRLRAIFDEGKPNWLASVTRDRLTAADVVQLLDTQSYFDLLKLPYPATRDAVLDRLVREHLVLKSGNGYSITNLGGLLFAKRLDEFDQLARKAPRVIAYEGTSKLKTRIDKPDSRGYAVGFEGLIDFINGQIPSNEVIEKALQGTATRSKNVSRDRYSGTGSECAHSPGLQ